MTESPVRIPISPEDAIPWVEVAQKARIDQFVMMNAPVVIDASNFGTLDGYFPNRPPSLWCRSYIDAALEHMGLWADHVAPLSFTEDAEIVHALRPSLTLARAAVESAGQAVWLLDPGTLEGCAERHTSLVLHDVEEQSKYLAEPEKAEARKSATDLRGAYEELYGRPPSPFPGYMSIVDAAARTVVSKGGVVFSDEWTVEQLWRASAGAAHGKRWPSVQFRVAAENPQTGGAALIPNLAFMTSVVRLASSVVNYAVLRYVDFAGHAGSLPSLLESGMVDLWSRIPRSEGPRPPSSFS